MRFCIACLPGNPLIGKKVAVIGAGPAGLAAACFLGCSGATVDVYDKMPEGGGMIVFAIPEERFPPDRVRTSIKEISEGYGVNFILNTKVVGEVVSHDEGDELAKNKISIVDIVKEYDAALIATGTWRSRELGIPGEDLGNVFKALDLLFKLKAFRLGYLKRSEVPALEGRRVAVIGAGLSAIDAATEALKWGASEVYMLYRRTIKEAPAGEAEIRRAISSGVKWVELVVPTRILGSGGVVKSLELVRCKLGEPDESGRPKPIPIPGSGYVIEVDVVVNSTGEIATPPIRDGELGIRLSRDGRILVDERRMTARKGVFAAGDVVLGPSRIGRAMKDGLEAGKAIADYLLKL